MSKAVVPFVKSSPRNNKIFDSKSSCMRLYARALCCGFYFQRVSDFFFFFICLFFRIAFGTYVSWCGLLFFFYFIHHNCCCFCCWSLVGWIFFSLLLLLNFICVFILSFADFCHTSHSSSCVLCAVYAMVRFACVCVHGDMQINNSLWMYLGIYSNER